MKIKQILISCLPGILILFVLSKPGIQLRKTHASDLVDSAPVNITRDRSLKNIPQIEASGLIYLRDLNLYALISDETQDNRPVLYLMNMQGHVEQAVTISGIDRIKDMEAVCNGENRDIYIICSQSLNKKGRISDNRKLFIRIERDSMNFYLKDSIFLYDLLAESIINSKEPELKQIKPAKNRLLNIDIEGMFFHHGAIFLGLKKPLKHSRSIILKIDNIKQVLKENRIRPDGIALWRTLDLKDRVTGLSSGISDLCLHEKTLFILSYKKIEKDSLLRKTGLKKLGNLWAYDPDRDRLSMIKTFKNMQPEGIAIHFENERTDSKEYHAIAIVFDNGQKSASQFMELLVHKKKI